MSSQIITQQAEFVKLCQRLRESPQVSFDTEFVSEFTYRPRLCLLQFATRDLQVAVDPFELTDLTPWWEIMADDATEIIVHGGREEILFCWHALGQPPRKLIDVQIVQGLLSRGYPLSHSALIQKVLRRKVSGKETRTDWAKRPLTSRQIEYAIEDVVHLIDVVQKQKAQLQSTRRESWAEEECTRFVQQLVESQQQRHEAWIRLPKVSRLQPREMAIARALFLWREKQAEKLDKPVRSLLRDDLLVDLAQRQPSSQSEILSTRDMQRSGYRRHLTDLVSVIDQARQLPESEWPRLPEEAGDHWKQEEHVLGKLLAIALANQCAELDLSPALLATANDLRDFVRWYQDRKRSSAPKLASGWRYEICGQILEDLLDGKVSLRVSDPDSDHPLIFEAVSPEISRKLK